MALGTRTFTPVKLRDGMPPIGFGRVDWRDYITVQLRQPPYYTANWSRSISRSAALLRETTEDMTESFHKQIASDFTLTRFVHSRLDGLAHTLHSEGFL